MNDVMRFLTWNLNHRTLPKKVPPLFPDVIRALALDIAVFTEYVPGPHHNAYMEALSSAGLLHCILPPFAAKQNHILVASRFVLDRVTIEVPSIAPAVPTNTLRVHIADKGFDLIGLRVPDYSRWPSLRRACWKWIEDIARSVAVQPFVLMGDFNTDPGYSPAKCGDRLARLEDFGWRRAAPESKGSYWTPKGYEVSIDHAFFTPHFQIHKAEYIREVDGTVLAGRKGAISDHAALLVEAEIKSK